jgi:predicted nucleic-acid-binding Zn-ribbon protein
MGIIKGYRRGASMKYVCSNCGYVGKPKIITKGSFAIKVFVRLLLLTQGLIPERDEFRYLPWRSTTISKACPKCRTPNMIPEDTPKGQELIAKFKA